MNIIKGNIYTDKGRPNRLFKVLYVVKADIVAGDSNPNAIVFREVFPDILYGSDGSFQVSYEFTKDSKKAYLPACSFEFIFEEYVMDIETLMRIRENLWWELWTM